jgi:predicted hotdog family 3-hydroxylacyl-ACP dehydratase
MTPSLHDIDVHGIIPQQEPFVFISELTEMTDTVTKARFVVKEDNVLMHGDTLHASALVEVVAQTCSARLGYYNKYVFHRDLEVGYIGAVRNLRIMAPVRAGDVLDTTITLREQVLGVTLVDAEVRCGSTLVAQGSMKIAVGPASGQ